MQITITHNIPAHKAESDLIRTIEKAISMHPDTRKTYTSQAWAAYASHLRTVITSAIQAHHVASVMQGITADPEDALPQ